MGPPLRQSPIQIDIVGTAELDAGDVSKGDRKKIKMFVDETLLERRATRKRSSKLIDGIHSIESEYTIHPVARAPDADYPLWRFNCAGFVLKAYLEADIELVDQEHAPLVTLDFLKRAFPSSRDRLDDPEFRKYMGIDVGDRWPVIMAGHVVNSLNRSAEEIRQTPYRPVAGDEFFPTKAQVVEEEATPPAPPAE